jgi:hypothetical protein
MRAVFHTTLVIIVTLSVAFGAAAQDNAPIARRHRTPEGPAKTIINAATVVPMTWEAHSPVVDVIVDDQGPLHFAIDTGSGAPATITRALAGRLHLTKIGEALAGDPSGLHNSTRDLVRLPSIAIAGVRFEGITASVVDGGPLLDKVDGILGFALFHDLLFTLDYPRNELRLEPGSLPPADGKRILMYEDSHGVPNIEATAAGKAIRFDVDAGAPGNITFPIASSRTLPTSGELELVGRGRTNANEFQIFASRLAGDFQVGDIAVTNPPVTFVEILPTAHLGFRFLRDYAVTFDQKNHRIRFARGSQTK